MQGTWLACYRDVPEVQLISASFAKVLVELATRDAYGFRVGGRSGAWARSDSCIACAR